MISFHYSFLYRYDKPSKDIIFGCLPLDSICNEASNEEEGKDNQLEDQLKKKRKQRINFRRSSPSGIVPEKKF